MPQTDKHAPHVDDGIKDERRSGSEGYRHQERPIEDDAVPGVRGGTHLPPPRHPEDAAVLDDEAVDDRSDLARFIEPAAFPATGDELYASAVRNDAPRWVLDALERLPADITFTNVQEVWQRLGGPAERHA